MEYMISVINYQGSDSLGGRLKIFLQPFLKIATDRLFFSVFAIYRHFKYKLWKNNIFSNLDNFILQFLKLTKPGLPGIFYSFPWIILADL